jgi:hypothetical protein
VNGQGTLRPDAAAAYCSVSRDTFDARILPSIRVVRLSARCIIVPIAELDRWLDENAARLVDE